MFGHSAFAEAPFGAVPGAAAPPSSFEVAWATNRNQLVWNEDMKKNVAGQVIGVQMVSATDGSAFTGTATVVITGDGGTQSASGGTGPTHEGNGYHTYVPTQAETNFDHIGFTFTGSGAVPSTIQVYTDFPQTGDNFARIGAPVGASISADVASVQTDTTAIVADTNELQGDWANGGRLDLILDARASQTTADAIETDTQNIQSRIPAALVGGAMNADVSAIQADTITAASIAADAGAEIADAMLDRDMSTGTDSGSATVRTPRQALRFLRNKWSIAGSTLTVTEEDDTTASWTATLTTDAAADPVTGSDPADA